MSLPNPAKAGAQAEKQARETTVRLAQITLAKAQESANEEKWSLCGTFAGAALEFVEELTGTDIAVIKKEAKKFIRVSIINSGLLWKSGNPYIPHKGFSTAQYSFDGRFIASIFPKRGIWEEEKASLEKNAYIWDAKSGKQIYHLKNGHTQSISCIDFGPKSNLFATGSSDNTIILWNVDNGKKIARLFGHFSNIEQIAFSPTSKLLASYGRDANLIIWDIATKKQVNQWSFSKYKKRVFRRGQSSKVVKSLDFHPKKNIIALVINEEVLLWDIKQGKSTAKFTLNTRKRQRWRRKKRKKSISLAKFGPHGKYIAGVVDKTIVFWKYGKEKPITTFKLFSHAIIDPIKYKGIPLAFSPTEKIIACSSNAQTIEIRSIPKGKKLYKLKGFSVPVESLDFSPDGKTLISASAEGIFVWDMATRKLLLKPLDHGHFDSVHTVKFGLENKTISSISEDGHAILWDVVAGKSLYKKLLPSVANISSKGKYIAFATNNSRIVVWDMVARKQKYQFTENKRAVSKLFFSEDNSKLIALNYSPGAITWDLANGKMLSKLPVSAVAALALNFDGSTLAAAHKKKIVLWNIYTGKTIGELKGHLDRATYACFNANGKMLASSSFDNNINLWDISTHKLLRSIKNIQTTSIFVANERKLYKIPKEEILLRFSPDNKFLATATSMKSVILWDVASGQRLYDFYGHTGDVDSLFFSPNSKILASASSKDPTILLWDTTTGTLLRKLTGHLDAIESLDFSSNGKKLVSSSKDRTIALWDISFGRIKKKWKAHKKSIRVVAFHPKKNIFASGSSDKSILVWDTSGKQLQKLKEPSHIIRLCFHPQKKILASLTNKRNILLWDVTTGEVLKDFQGVFRSASFSPDGQKLAIASSRDISIWETDTEKLIKKIEPSLAEPIFRVDFHPHGKLLAKI